MVNQHFWRPLALAACLGMTAAGCGDGGDSSDPSESAGGGTGDTGVLGGGVTPPLGGAAAGGQGGGGGHGPEWDAGTGGGGGGAGGGEAPEFVVETLLQDAIVLNAGITDDIRFTVPEDAVGLSIFAIGETTGMYVVEHLEDPTGEAIVTDNPPGGISQSDQFLSPWPGQFKSPNRATATEAMATLLVPNNPDITLMPGEWTMRIAGANSRSGRPMNGALPLTIRVKRAAKAPTRGILKLNLYFTGARGWTAATAPDDADFRATLFRMGSFYGEIGIEVQAASYHDIDASFRVIDTFQGEPNNELSQLFSTATTDEGVNLFFVDRFAGQQGGAIGGIAGAIPGPSGPGLGGTTRSGVCVATSIDPNPLGIGHIMGHETGHFLGLFHTSELFVQGVNDPIPDTPMGQAGATNLMFPTVTTAPAHMTPQQGIIVRGNPTIFTSMSVGANP